MFIPVGKYSVTVSNLFIHNHILFGRCLGCKDRQNHLQSLPSNFIPNLRSSLEEKTKEKESGLRLLTSLFLDFFILLPSLNKEAKEADMMTQPPVREIQSSEKVSLSFKRV